MDITKEPNYQNITSKHLEMLTKHIQAPRSPKKYANKKKNSSTKIGLSCNIKCSTRQYLLPKKNH